MSLRQELLTDAGSVVAFVPTFPGDLVASRSALRLLCDQARVMFVVRQQLVPLLDGIDGDILAYDLPWPFDPMSPTLLHGVPCSRMPDRSLVIDLIGMPASMQMIRSLGGYSIGHAITDGVPTPYTFNVPWNLGAEPDRTHFAIRMLRLVPGLGDTMGWPRDVFERACFPEAAHGDRRIALAPGCGRDGCDKRMPVTFWRDLAYWLRSNCFAITWFLGPDEIELAPLLVHASDKHEGGDWDSAIRAHLRCGLGITHDTCHMHLRVHLAGLTFAVFRRPDMAEWGAYPKYVTCIGPCDFPDAEQAARLAKQWVLDQTFDKRHSIADGHRRDPNQLE
jgi:hypothetical protein